MRSDMLTRSLFLLTIILTLALTACATPTPGAVETLAPMDTSTPTPSAFRVIGYVTETVIVNQLPYDKLTHINYAFLIPNADGTLAPLVNAWKINELTQKAHENGVKVVISVGGWGWDAQFEALAADPQKRAAFVKGLIGIVAEYGFDGVDIDWEYPDPGQSAQNFLALMTELRAALPGKLLTAAVVSYGDETAHGIPAETFALMDYVNVMTYDGPDHGTLEQFEKGLNYWLTRGVPKDKLCMGVPFYSRPSEVSYSKLVVADPAAAQIDSFDFAGAIQHYNGVPTITQKTKIALEKASGIMIWTVEYDAPGDASLLTAINKTIASYKP
jgi:chitinase